MGIHQFLLGGQGVPGVGVPENMSRWIASDFQYSPASSFARIRFMADGTIDASGMGRVAGSSNWYNPTTGAVGAGYWVRATKTSGDDPSSGVLNTWLQLSSDRIWQNDQSTVGGRSSEITFDFSTMSDGSVIVASIPLWIISVQVGEGA